MDIIQQIKNIAGSREIYDTFKPLNQELQKALSLYWDIAAQILNKSGINVLPPEPEYFSIEKNFFSALFLYSYFRAGIPQIQKNFICGSESMPCGGMVTGVR